MSRSTEEMPNREEAIKPNCSGGLLSPPGKETRIDDIIEYRPELIGNPRFHLVARISRQRGLPEQYLLIGLSSGGEKTLVPDGGPFST